MEPARIIYERGITVGKVGTEWHLHNLISGGTVRIEQPAVASAAYGVGPIVITEILPDGQGRDLLLCKAKPELYGLKITDVHQLSIRLGLPLYKMVNGIYLLQSAEYHCVQLCKHYSSICEVFCHFQREGLTESSIAFFQGRSEPYFEFDALVTAVRRAYDSCRYLMWQYFGPEKGSVPGSFYKALPLCTSLPVEVSQRLADSWSNFGDEVTEYRDCIQHYTPIDFGLTSVHMEKLDRGAWCVNALIPDNPSARARGKFTYSKKRDALKYGWEIANEILEVTTVLVNAIKARLGIQQGAQQRAPAD